MKNHIALAVVSALALSLTGTAAMAEGSASAAAQIQTANRELMMAVDLMDETSVSHDPRPPVVGLPENFLRLPENFLRTPSYTSAFEGAERVVVAAANPATAQMGMARNGGTAVTGAGFSSNVFLELLQDGTEMETEAAAGGGEVPSGELAAVAMRARVALAAADYALWMEKYGRATATLSATRAEPFVGFARPVVSIVAMERMEMTKIDRPFPAVIEASAVDKLSIRP